MEMHLTLTMPETLLTYCQEEILVKDKTTRIGFAA
jgi:hypothetical protein